MTHAPGSHGGPERSTAGWSTEGRERAARLLEAYPDRRSAVMPLLYVASLEHGYVTDEAMAVEDGDVTLVPKGYPPCAATHGYDLYYLNVMAGPLRKWRFGNHPDHAWIYERDA